MKKSLGLALALTGALAIGTPAFAASQAKAHHRMNMANTVSGTIESYDATTHMLQLKAPKGNEEFSAADAKVWVASKSVEVAQLGSEVGARASVTYATKDGKKLATAVHVTPAKQTAKK